MRTQVLVAAVLASVVGSPSVASAERLFELSGTVGLADGNIPSDTTVRLGVDLNRNGELESFETVKGTIDSSGNYQLGYELDPADVDLELITFAAGLVAEYQARGFDALLDDGPLPLVVTVEREGYSTITRTLSALLDNPRVDALLTPLEQVHCRGGVCQSPSGGIEISGFPGGTGIARAFAEEYDPTLHTSRFPGSFSDSENNLLISSGFVEVDLRDENGAHVSNLSAPVKVRFRANESSWNTLRDLEPNTGRIEVPMYSFNETNGLWVAEPDGVLEDAKGALVPEPELAAIKSGTYAGPIYITFSTKHFSTFNCDEPVEARACVKGRVVGTDGQPLSGVSVSANGVNYTGSAGTMTTNLDGAFAADVLKSELSDEDVDYNGEFGQTFTASVVVASELGLFRGRAFDSPSTQGSIGGNIATCRPEECDCVDLGDIEVELEEPRACEVTVRATFSGQSSGEPPTLEAGDPIEGAIAHGNLLGIEVPVSAIANACAGVRCHGGFINADGTSTFVVPVVGDESEVQIRVQQTLKDGDISHMYTGEVTVAGCARGEAALSAVVEVQANHKGLGDMGAYIGSLGNGGSVGSGGGVGSPYPTQNDEIDPLQSPGCGCDYAGAAGQVSALAGGLVGTLGLLLRRRSRRNAGV